MNERKRMNVLLREFRGSHACPDGLPFRLHLQVRSASKLPRSPDFKGILDRKQ
jgi:hypothetical protein